MLSHNTKIDLGALGFNFQVDKIFATSVVMK